MTFKHKRRALGLFSKAAALLAALGVGGLIFWAEFKIKGLVLGGLGEGFSTRLYAFPFVVEAGSPYSPEALLQRLKRLNYQPSSDEMPSKGAYTWEPPRLTVHLRGFEAPFLSQNPGVLVLTQKHESHWEITDPEGTLVNRIILEPELIADLSGPKRVRREPAQWEEFPFALVHAVVAVEDKRFFRHWGLDPRAIARALLQNVKRGKTLQGGSTITQQLTKNLFLTPKRTWTRKVADAVLAIYIDIRFSKEKILTIYLNHIYLGQTGSLSIAGMKTAADFYFHKDLSELTLPECALLAGLIRSPYLYNPFRHPDQARERRNFVLKRMFEEGIITQEEYESSRAEKIKVMAAKDKGSALNAHDYFVAEVLRQLFPDYSEETIFRYGLKIFTTMDPVLQEAGHRAVQASPFQAALIALDAESGRVLALTGGKNFEESQFNRATQALRQPGSAFKPFVYGAALEKKFTTSAILKDEPRVYEGNKSLKWSPKNVNEAYFGDVSLRNALALSLNAATLDLAKKVGPHEVVSFARRMGIQSPLEADLAIGLGAYEVTPLELTAAYAPFANGGYQISPHLIASIVDAEDNVVELRSPEKNQVLEPAVGYVITSLLQSVIKEGTAKHLKALGWDLPSAGKTGTTNQGRDAWFVGYTPDLLAGVWVGHDEAKAVYLTGGRDAVPIWSRFMKEAHKTRVPKDFALPAGITTVKIDPVSGLAAVSGCPSTIEEIFVSGTAPLQTCTVHASGIKGWFQRLFKKSGDRNQR